ncbi:hypothetical protein Tco_1199800, partial [Tanacetum coccineum]
SDAPWSMYTLRTKYPSTTASITSGSSETSSADKGGNVMGPFRAVFLADSNHWYNVLFRRGSRNIYLGFLFSVGFASAWVAVGLAEAP